jgi:hypothetical protein
MGFIGKDKAVFCGVRFVIAQVFSRMRKQGGCMND